MSALDNQLADEISKRRLLIDGDGAGDDRKIFSLTKSFINICNTSEETPEEMNSSFRKLIAQIQQIDFIASKTHFAIKVNENTKNYYKASQNENLGEMEKTKAEIIRSKEQLEEATKLRKHSMEYDALAKIIETQPDRRETEKVHQELQCELEILKKRKEDLFFRLESRKKNMEILVAAVANLEDLMNDAEKDLNDKVVNIVENQEDSSSPMDVDIPISKSESSVSIEEGRKTKGKDKTLLDKDKEKYEELSDEGETAD